MKCSERVDQYAIEELLSEGGVAPLISQTELDFRLQEKTTIIRGGYYIASDQKEFFYLQEA